jgi:hypothetical protein
MARSRAPSPQTLRVLRALAADPARWRYGYELVAETELKAGSLYPILVRLADRGLLDAMWEESLPHGRPPRHLYRLTQAGLDASASAPAPAASPAASAVTVVAWVPLGAALYLSTVVFPSSTVSPLSILTMDAYVIAAMMAAGVAARRGCTRPAALVIAGIAAGILIATLSLALLEVIGATTVKTATGAAPAPAPGISIFAPVFGAILAPLGAALSRGRSVTRDHRR